MTYVALDPHSGKPRPGDLVWSALPDAPVEEPRAPGLLVRTLRRAAQRRATRVREREALRAQAPRRAGPARPSRT